MVRGTESGSDCRPGVRAHCCNSRVSDLAGGSIKVVQNLVKLYATFRFSNLCHVTCKVLVLHSI